MKDATRMPTTLKRLEEIITGYEDELLDNPPEVVGVNEEVMNWLRWSLCHLENRKQYHRKRALKLGLLKKMAETLLSEDELARIDEEAEAQLAGVEASDDGSNNKDNVD